MLSFDCIKSSKVYQEAKEEGKQEKNMETIPKLVKFGLTLEQIAESLDLDLETVRKIANSQ